MSQTWRQKHTAVTDFVVNHPEIKIGSSVVRIPETVRPEFNRFSWNAREAFLEETSRALLDEAEVLSQEYLKVKEEVIKLLGLEGISSLIPVDSFLANPAGALINALRGPFFDLLKGRMDITGYEKEASAVLMSSFDLFYQRGYEMWLVLSLIKLLEADKSFRVDTDEFDCDEYFAHGPGVVTQVLKPKELNELSFKHNPEIGILVADQIVHSSKYGQYFSFRPHIVKPIGPINSKSVKREWLLLPVNTIRYMERNAIMVYTDKSLEELVLIADSKYFCRPDLILVCFGLKKLYKENSLDKINDYQDNFKPRLGTYVVSREPLVKEMPEAKRPDIVPGEPATEKVSEDEPVDIHFLPVGFDRPKLEHIVNLLVAENSSHSPQG